MVGFQTKLKHGEQVRIFRMIPGLENAEFARLGGIHRNSFINSPRLLDRHLRLKSKPNIRFAGQITGCEGYVESAAIGLLGSLFAAAELRGKRLPCRRSRRLAERFLAISRAEPTWRRSSR
jgi:methylenetetrahydrofolate--tRNA-(uracil-5-)-methyltransferase